VEAKLKSVDQSARDVRLRQSGDVAEAVTRVEWHQRIHEHLVLRDPKPVGDTLGHVGENLARRVLGAHHKWIVESIVEAELDERRVSRSRRHATRRLH